MKLFIIIHSITVLGCEKEDTRSYGHGIQGGKLVTNQSSDKFLEIHMIITLISTRVNPM